jgi:hypothetical protein
MPIHAPESSSQLVFRQGAPKMGNRCVKNGLITCGSWHSFFLNHHNLNKEKLPIFQIHQFKKLGHLENICEKPLRSSAKVRGSTIPPRYLF